MKMKGTKMKRFLAFFMALAMLMGNVPAVFAAQTGLCDHHTAHEGCGYAEAVPGNACTHAHGPECYTEQTLCVHTHTDCGYSEVPEENGCTHSCSAETGCVTEILACAHVHGDCGYSEGTAGSPCGYECRICAIQELIDALPEEVPPENRASVEAQLTAIDEKRLELTDEELEQVDFAKYQAAIAAISALEGMAGAEEPAPVPAATSGTLGDNITWELDLSTGVLTITGSGVMKDLPGSGNQPWGSYGEYIKTVTVSSGITNIGNYMFTFLDELTSVSLPEGITRIGASSFEWCSKLTDIVIPSTLEEVGYRAFYLCESLTSVQLPNGVTGIGYEAFNRCTALSSVTIPGTVKNMGEAAFAQCPELKSAGPIGSGCDIEFGWTASIPEYAFYNTSNIVELTLPAGLKQIGRCAFMYTNITEVVIPDGVTTLGYAAFGVCELEKVTIPGSVTGIDCSFTSNNALLTAGPIGSGCDIEFGWTDTIPERAFVGCNGLTAVTLPSTLKKVAASAFNGCESLAEITIPAFVTSIGEYAFSGTGIKTVTFKGSAPSIDTGALRDVTAVATYPADNATWTDSVRKDYGGTITWVGLGGTDGLSGQCGDDVYWTIDTATGTMSVFGTGPMWDYDSDKEPAWGIYKERRDQITTLTFSEGITRIGESTFGNFSKLTSLTIPDSVTLIDEYAFGSCSALKTLDLGDGCSLGEGAFIYCPIRELELGKSGSFGTQCFTSSYITSITITANSPSFREGAFWNCTGLKEVHFKGSAPGSVTDKGFVSSLASFRDVTWYYECGKSGWTTSSRYNAADKTWAGYTLVSEGHTYTSSTTSASCTQPGGTTYTCACGDTYTVPGTGVLGHDWSDWTTTEATCTADGSRTRSCKRSGCGETETETIPSQGHQEVCELDYEPTCIKDGQWGGCWCVNCGKVFKEKEIRPATGVHTFGTDFKCTSCDLFGGQCGKNVYWTLEDGVVTVSGSGDMYWQVPEWQRFKDQITTVVIGDGVTSVGGIAFSDCTMLTSVTLPDGLKSIEYSAFYGCTGLKKIHIPDSVTFIGNTAFASCKNLSEVNIPAELTEMGIQAFADCSALACTITIPSGLKMIPDRAFLNDSSLKTVVFSEGLTQIAPYAFCGCSSLEAAALPKGLMHIGEQAFARCSSLKSVTFPEGLTTVGGFAFMSTALTEAELPEGFTQIPVAMFQYCTSLERVHIPDTVTSIGPSAFGGCQKLHSVILPSGLTELPSAVLQGTAITELVIPEGVKSIGELALNGCDKLTTVVIPAGVTAIGAGAFNDCTALTAVTLPDGLTTLSSQVFWNCDSLTELTIPAGVTRLEKWALALCQNLKTIRFLGDAPTFADDAFSVVTATAHYPGGNSTWTEAVMQDYGGHITWIAESYENRVYLDPSKFGDTVYVDGLPIPVIRTGDSAYVDLPEGASRLLVTYSWHTGDGTDVHTHYPTGMKVYKATEADGSLAAVRISELDDLLQYSGSSIRITGNKGIRMITSMEKSKKDALTGAGLAGYTLVEYGTALCWSSDLAGGRSLILGQDYTRSNYAYRKGVADPVFAYSGSLVQYTNVLVGFDNDQCKDDIAMRSYIILEDADGDQVTIYGGTVHRSIGYIAYQNRAAFAPGSAAYEYVWDIIHHVYGDMYDEDYEG